MHFFFVMSWTPMFWLLSEDGQLSWVCPRPSERGNLQLYQRLINVHCSNLTQIQTGKTGLMTFLHQWKILRVGSPCCSCGQGVETPKHVLVHCVWLQKTRISLKDFGWMDLRCLLCTKEGARKLSHWWLNHDVLQQFRLVRVQEIGIVTV